MFMSRISGEGKSVPEAVPQRTAHIFIRGRVQGVGFRAWVLHQAQLRGLAGWVRNRRDGAVEALFRGSDHVVEAMLDVCREGPSNALVDRLELVEPNVQEPASSERFGSERFRVLETF